jgi:hypothetical protein
MHRSLRILTLLAGIAILGVPSSARADFAIRFHEAGFADLTVKYTDAQGAAGQTIISEVFHDFQITVVFGKSNVPGTTFGNVQLSNTLLVNTNAAKKTLTVSVSGQDFTSPISPPPLILSDTVSGSVLAGTASGSAQGFGDSGNALFGTGTPSAVLTIPSTSTTGSFSVSGSTTFSPGPGKYSMTFSETLTVSGLGTLTTTGGNVQDMAVSPAPPTFVLMGLGVMCVLGVGYYRRGRLVTA